MIEEIISKKEWHAVLEEVDTYDFYHTFDYHNISCDSSNELPILIKYSKDNIVIALPLLLRSIPNTSYFDFTSVYGYPGPISSGINADFNNEGYVEELQAYFVSKNIVSVFTRLHPYIKLQSTIFACFGDLTSLGRIVNINVGLPIEESRRAYQKSLKNQVNKLRKTCIVRKAESDADILEFVSIYHENMKRLNAANHYFFKTEYFLNFVKQTDFKTDILLVEENVSKRIIAGSMFIKTKEFVQFHLSGTKTDYLHLKPSKLFLDEMRLEATNEKFNYFSLGGGFESNEDSLFEFKASFSKDFRRFKIFKHIVNQSVYTKLSSSFQKNVNLDYFPLYRA